MKIHLWLGIALFPLLGQPAIAQEKDKEPRPTLPLVAPLPKMCAWTMSFKTPTRAKSSSGGDAEPAESPSDNRRISSIQNVQTGPTRFAVVSESNGKKTQFYHVSGRSICLPPGSPRPVVVEPSANISLYDYFSPGFYGMDSIRIDDFKETVKVGDMACHHYEGKLAKKGQQAIIRGPSDEAPKEETSEYEAWINAETRLPVALREGSQVISYTFQPTPQSELVLAPEFKASWDQYQGNLQRLEKMRKR